MKSDMASGMHPYDMTMLVSKTWSHLPLELLQLVLEQLFLSSKADCCSLCTLSKWFSGLCIPVLYQTVTLRCNDTNYRFCGHQSLPHTSTLIILDTAAEPGRRPPPTIAIDRLQSILLATVNVRHATLSDYLLVMLSKREADQGRAFEVKAASLQIIPHSILSRPSVAKRHHICARLIYSTILPPTAVLAVTHLHFHEGAVLEPGKSVNVFPNVTHIAWSITCGMNNDNPMSLLPRLANDNFPAQLQLAVLHLIITDQTTTLPMERMLWVEALADLNWPASRVAFIMEWDARLIPVHHSSDNLDIWTRAQTNMLENSS